MKFIIGSKSQRKIDVTKRVIGQFFNQKDTIVESCDSKSQVPDTPYDKQTFDGARNRALDCISRIGDSDYCIGLESGLIERYGHMYEEAWAAIITKDGKEYYGYSSGLKVPDYILKKMDELKMEHSNVMTIIEKEFGDLPNDTWGTYSGGMIVREISLEESIRNALIQIVASDKSFYKK